MSELLNFNTLPKTPTDNADDGRMSLERDLKEASHDKMPLHSAAKQGDTKAVRNLLDKGTAMDEEDSSGNTALSLAVKAGQFDVVRLFCEEGAALDLYDNDEMTVLMTALSRGHTAIAHCLIEFGADCSLSGNDNATALSIALWNCEPPFTPSSQDGEMDCLSEHLKSVNTYHKTSLVLTASQYEMFKIAQLIYANLPASRLWCALEDVTDEAALAIQDPKTIRFRI